MTCAGCGRERNEYPRRGLCHACYERDRRAGRIDSLTSSEESRGHIVLLCVNGWRYREIARAAGIDRSLVAWIMRGRERIQAKTARRICGIDPAVRADYVQHIEPRVALARARKAALSLGQEGAKARARKAAASMTPEARSARARKSNAAMTAEARSERAFKIWAIRRARQRRCSYEELRDEWEQRHPVRQLIPAPGVWACDALCAQIDTEMFFPDKGGSTREAKRVCPRCDVREECLQFALDNDIRYGIFGGLSVRERLRRR
jgi:WhiB family redox-sensing transcriptional regulator